MTFKEWMLKYREQDSPRGDLARDIGRDPSFPADSEQARAYLSTKLVNFPEAHAVFKRCYRDYLKSLDN